MAKDPVCGMEVDPNKTANRSVYLERTYHFCSSGCKTAFDKAPATYTLGAEPNARHK